MRKQKLFLNTITSLINQIAMVVCAFILPKLILDTFGSNVNGLVSSVTQFLTVVSLMEFGVGAVIQSALYKPLANHDNYKISCIIKSADKFFKNIAVAMTVYILILIFVYPTYINKDFSFLFTATLIISMSISYFAQYFFGLKYQLLLIADQRGYVHYFLNTVALILNNIFGVILIINGFNIQLVKLVSSLCLLIRPLFLFFYVKKHYCLTNNVQYTEEPIKQKWNGISQHIASVVLNSTDTIILTCFSTLSNVSIYNVYYLIVNGLRNLVISITSGITSLIGNLLAKNELEKLTEVFNVYESFFHFMVCYIFGCAAVLSVPFIQVYTKSVTDASYIVPEFAVLLCMANLSYCLRQPYNSIVMAAGHYKQTQNSAWIEMIINLIISIIFVSSFGLIGVAVGTLMSMLYRTIYMVFYLSKNILMRNIRFFLKHLLVDLISILSILFFGYSNILQEVNIISWIVLAIKFAIINLIICFCIHMIFYRKDFKKINLILKKKIKG